MDPCWKTLSCVYNRTIVLASERTSSSFKLGHEHDYEQAPVTNILGYTGILLGCFRRLDTPL